MEVTYDKIMHRLRENDSAGGGASFEAVIARVLPASGENGKIYLVPNQGTVPDIYDEYIWIASTTRFERIGSTQITLSLIHI